jgi:hypothetical protein
MTAIRLRPEGLRVPWQGICGFALVLYSLRSALRGWDFRPDLLDAIVFGGLLIVLVARPLLDRWLDGGEDKDAG